MKAYLELVKTVLREGKMKPNRTGTPALTIPGAMLQHDLRQGFPAVTTKKLAFKSLKVELEGFLKGITDKHWYQERGSTIWDEWCNPKKIPPGLNDKERKSFQQQETDLGKIYGYQWRNFGGVDQLQTLVDMLKTDPMNRRMLVSAWNPTDLPEMALPPCHVLFHVVVIDTIIHLTWFQRSCDLLLGIPFNLGSYALLLHLLALESGLTPGVVTGMLSDVHIYENHISGAKEQLTRSPYPLPKIHTASFNGILNWEHSHTRLEGYQHHPRINFKVAV